MVLPLAVAPDLGANHAVGITLRLGAANTADACAPGLPRGRLDPLDLQRAGARAIVRADAVRGIERQTHAPADVFAREYQGWPIVVKRLMPAALDDPILRRFRAALDQLYGERIERIVLYGSRARGDAHEESDYDVAVFLHDLTNRRDEVRRMVPIVVDIIDDTGAVIHAMPCRAGAYNDRTSLMRELRIEGVDL